MTDSTPPPLGLALRHAHLRAARVFAEELGPLGVENIVAGVLMHLGHLGPQTQRQLVERVNSDKSAMVRYIDALEARGLVRREPHPTDRRAQLIVLTDAGRVLLAEVQEAADRTEDRLTDHLTPEERELFHRLLVRFTYD
ncbi:MarR family winged helix-turn-helix transcriptional regulator [Streptacidiphilus rugosus]|uniref:MarR family winged helix-turn-helix transcriptional regulator n=1 Tax=Streptacidiphilus rugosus TaxID=405783 RepID=UPI00068F7AE1|nr:MarR family transcriptional regulator [Streptacidiphilus rugosus]